MVQIVTARRVVIRNAQRAQRDTRYLGRLALDREIRNWRRADRRDVPAGADAFLHVFCISIFLSIWPWALYFFDRAYAQLRVRDSIAFGILIAAALMSKYFALILCATCFIAALQRPERARYFESASPYISVAVAALLCSPHIFWLLVSGAPPLHYLGSVSGLGIGAALNNVQATLFGSIAALAAPIALVALAARKSPRETRAWFSQHRADPQLLYLTTLAWAPLMLSLFAGLAMQVKLATPMLMGVFVLAPLWLLRICEPVSMEALARLAKQLASALSICAVCVSPIVAFASVELSSNPKFIEPRKELAGAATKVWTDATGLPLAYVAGTPYYDDAVVFYSEQRPHAFSDFDFYRNRWVTPDDLIQHGLLSVCVADDSHCLASTKAFANSRTTRVEITLSHMFLGHEAKAVKFVVTAIPPNG
jgi:hypothetical protein